MDADQEEAFLDAVAQQHVVTPLAERLDGLGLGESASQELRSLWRGEATAALAAVATVNTIMTILDQAGVRCLTYKGVALATATTGNAVARGACDVDILVAPADAPAAHDALVGHGATFIHGYSPPPDSDLWPWARRVNCEIPYDWRGVPIDLHWRFDRLPQIASMDFEELWERRSEVVLAGQGAATLGEVDALLLTCAHGTKEHWRHWRWIVDLVRQARTITDWRLVLDRARTTGCEESLAVGLAVHEYLAPLPDTQGIAPGPRARRLAAWAWANSCAGSAPFGGVSLQPQVERLRWSAETLPSGRAAGSMIFRQAYTSLDMAELPLPSAVAWAYPLVRPVLWARRLATGRYGPRAGRGVADGLTDP